MNSERRARSARRAAYPATSSPYPKGAGAQRTAGCRALECK